MGSDYTLRCHVTHVFPIRLLRGDSEARWPESSTPESLERFTGLDLANVTLTYLLRSRPG